MPAIIGCCLPRGICTGVCLARCFGGWMHCRCRAGNTTIAVAKSGAEGGGSEQCLRTRLRGSKRGSSEGQKRAVGDSADPAGACSGGKSVVSRAGGAYNVRDRGQIGNSRFRPDLYPYQ